MGDAPGFDAGIEVGGTVTRAPRAYYYGCIERAGHYFWKPGEYGAVKVREKLAHGSAEGTPPPDYKPVVPWGYSVDGKLQPYVERDGKRFAVQGVSALHHKDGWTALAFWDRSVDERPGSSSTFVFEEILDFDAALVKARKLFPEVFERFDFKVVPTTWVPNSGRPHP